MREMDTPFSCEYSYERRTEGKRLLLRTLAIAGYVLFVVLYFMFAYFTMLIPLFALCPVTLWIIVYFTWPLLSYDYYFEFQTGTLSVGTERRRKKSTARKQRLSIRVKEAEKIYRLPVGRVKISGVDRCHDFSSTALSDKRIAIVFQNDGKKYACIIECTAALAKMLRSYSQNGEELADFANN